VTISILNHVIRKRRSGCKKISILQGSGRKGMEAVEAALHCGMEINKKI